MFEEITKVFKYSLVYGLPRVTSTFAAIFLVPIFTRVLSPDEYGIISLLNALVAISVIIYNFGINTAVFRFYYHSNMQEKKEVVSTAFFFQIILGLMLSTILLISSPSLNRLIFKSSLPLIFFYIVTLTVFFQAGFNIPLSILRAEEKPIQYACMSILQLALAIGLSIFLVAFIKMGVSGVILASLISYFLVYFLAVPFILRYIKVAISIKYLKEMFLFGWPLVPAGLAMWILNLSDRYFLNIYTDLSQVGVYNVGYRIGSLVVFVVGAIQLAFVPFIFSAINKPNAEELYKKFATYYLFIVFFIALAIAVFSKEAVLILTGAKFHKSYIVIPLVAFAYVAYGLFNVFAIGVYITKKTFFTAVATIFAASINAFLNITLIPKFGMVGAAYATLLSFIALALLTLLLSNWLYPIHYEFVRMAKIILVGFMIWCSSTHIQGSLFFSIPVKTLIIISYFPILYLIGFYHEDEIKRLMFIIKSLFPIETQHELGNV